MNNDYPKEYKRGYTNFAGCEIDLSMRPMIPRKETEFWIKKVIKEINLSRAKLEKNLQILDIFSGSGCIGIAVLKNCPGQCRRATFVEIDKNLIKQIKINLKLNNISPSRYKVVQSNIFRSLKDRILRAGFDYIFANPPYISLKNKHLVQKSVLDYEPHLALFGGEDGLLYIRKFLEGARECLKPNGKICMEFDWMERNGLEKLLKKLNYKNYKIYKDHEGRWRWICIEN
jgi:release factor glutamine methyltransferase